MTRIWPLYYTQVSAGFMIDLSPIRACTLKYVSAEETENVNTSTSAHYGFYSEKVTKTRNSQLQPTPLLKLLKCFCLPLNMLLTRCFLPLILCVLLSLAEQYVFPVWVVFCGGNFFRAPSRPQFSRVLLYRRNTSSIRKMPKSSNVA